MSIELVSAVEDADIEKIIQLLKQGADPNYVLTKADLEKKIKESKEDEDYSYVFVGDTPIYVCFQLDNYGSEYKKKQKEILEILIQNGADINFALEVAIAHRESDIVLQLLKNPKLKPPSKALLLDLAIEQNLTLEIMSALLENKAIHATLNTPNAAGVTPIFLAIKNNDVALIKLLLKHGADLYFPDSNGVVPIDLIRQNPNLLSALEKSIQEIKQSKEFEQFHEKKRRMQLLGDIFERRTHIHLEHPKTKKLFIPVPPELQYAFATYNDFLSAFSKKKEIKETTQRDLEKISQGYKQYITSIKNGKNFDAKLLFEEYSNHQFIILSVDSPTIILYKNMILIQNTQKEAGPLVNDIFELKDPTVITPEFFNEAQVPGKFMLKVHALLSKQPHIAISLPNEQIKSTAHFKHFIEGVRNMLYLLEIDRKQTKESSKSYANQITLDFESRVRFLYFSRLAKTYKELKGSEEIKRYNDLIGNILNSELNRPSVNVAGINVLLEIVDEKARVTILKNELSEIIRFRKLALFKYLSDKNYLNNPEVLNYGLGLAVKNNRIEFVKGLLELKATNPNTLDVLNNPLLMEAILKSSEMVKLFLNAGADPNLIGNDGESSLSLALYFRNKEVVKLMRSVENKNSIKHDLVLEKAAQLIKDAGHILGLSTNITLSTEHSGKRLIPTQSRSDLTSLTLLNRMLKAYAEQKQNKEIETYLETTLEPYSLQQSHLNMDEKASLEVLLQRYENHRPLLLIGGWLKHSVALIFYKNYVIVCNRGAGKTPGFSGTLVYELRGNMNLNALSHLYSAFNGKPRTEKDFKEALRHFINLDEPPLYQLPTKDQKHGTCSFVNAKSAIVGLLFILRLEELLKSLSKDAAVKSAMDFAMKIYKSFTNFMRETELNILMEGFKSEKDQTLKNVYYQIFTAIISAHHGQEDPKKNYPRHHKMEGELKRVLIILSQLSSKEIKIVLEPLKSLALIATFSKLNNTQIIADLLKLGFNINQPDNIGETALVKATRGKDEAMVKFLIENGAETKLASKPGGP